MLYGQIGWKPSDLKKATLGDLYIALNGRNNYVKEMYYQNAIFFRKMYALVYNRSRGEKEAYLPEKEVLPLPFDPVPPPKPTLQEVEQGLKLLEKL